MSVPEAIALVEVATKATAAYERADLGARLGHTTERLEDPGVRVLVVGEFKQGKSQLVNALVTRPSARSTTTSPRRCPPWCGTPTRRQAALVRDGAPAAARRSAPRCRSASSPQYVSRRATPATGRRCATPRSASRARCWPAAWCSSTRPASAASARRTGRPPWPRCPAADAVLMVSDAAQEYTGPELDFLGAGDEAVPERRRACSPRPTSTRTGDGSPSSTAATSRRRHHAPTSFPVSSPLRLHAANARARRLNDESGFPALVEFLLARGCWPGPTSWTAAPPRTTCWPCAEQLADDAAGRAGRAGEPGAADAAGGRADAGARPRRRAQASAPRAGRSPSTTGSPTSSPTSTTTCATGCARSAGEAEELLDDGRPAPRSGTSSPTWVHQQVCVGGVGQLRVGRRAGPLAGRAGGASTSPRTARGRPARRCVRRSPAHRAAGRRAWQQPGRRALGRRPEALTGMRGGYGGMLMIGMADDAAPGSPLLNPFSIGAGLLFGRKTVRDERRRMLQRRRRPRPSRRCAATSTR